MNVSQHVTHTTNTMLSGVLLVTAAVARAAAAGSAAGLVDEHEGGLLITGRTIRIGSCEDTECADHWERGLGD